MSWVFVLCVSVLLSSPLSAVQTKRSTAQVYASKAKQKLLFQWERVQKDSQDNSQVEVTFRSPQSEGNKLAVRERTFYENGKFKRYEIKRFQNNEEGWAEVRGDRLHFFYRESDGSTDADDESFDPNTILGDRIQPFLQKNWSKLLEGETVKARYIVVDRTETIGFQFKRDSDSKCGKRPSVVIKMQPSSFFLKAFVDPVYLNLVNQTPPRVCDYAGRIAPRKKEGDKWKPLDAHTFYDVKG